MYDFDTVSRLNIPAMKADQQPLSALVGKISQVFQEIRPDTIYLPFHSDVHSDHRVLFDAAYSCTKGFRYPFIRQILMMETLSETEFAPATQDRAFSPNLFLDISDYLEKKLEIMRVYKSEVGQHPFPRSEEAIRAKAFLRGAVAGCHYAESFVLLKEIR